MDAHFEQAKQDLWVFAYGSLMWQPGFDFLERSPAVLIGAHRALCVLSPIVLATCVPWPFSSCGNLSSSTKS